MGAYWCYTPLGLIIFMFIKLLKMRFHPSSPNFVRGVMIQEKIQRGQSLIVITTMACFLAVFFNQIYFNSSQVWRGWSFATPNATPLLSPPPPPPLLPPFLPPSPVAYKSPGDGGLLHCAPEPPCRRPLFFLKTDSRNTAKMCDDEEAAAMVIDNGSGMVKVRPDDWIV